MNIAVRGLAPTPTELEAHKRRHAFRDKIAAAAAALKAIKPAPRSIAPEAMPAETDPPRPRSVAELVQWRKSIAAELGLVDEMIERRSRHPPIRKIQNAVGARYRVSHNDLCSARRTREIVLPRQIGMYLCKTMTLQSLPAIGRLFGGKDHTTVLHAVRKIEHLVNTNPDVAAEVHALEKIILGEQGEAAA